MKSNRKELSNRMKEHEKKGELWTNMGTGKTCEAREPLLGAGVPRPGVGVPPSFFSSSNFCSNSKHSVVT